MPKVQLTLLIGRYAQEFYLRDNGKPTLTETVAAYREYLPHYLPLPHPSPRNRYWFATHPWFEQDVLPELRRRIQSILNAQ
jgi:uracil-DNA glycosylase